MEDDMEVSPMEDPAQQLVDVDAMGDGDGTGDPDAGLFKVSFRDFLELREQKYTSEEFTAAACKWCATHAYAPEARVVGVTLGLTRSRHSHTLFLDGTRRLLLFPRHGTGNSVGVFLEALPDANGVLAPRKCSFTIAVLGTGEPTLKTAQHVFSSDANDWGFSQLLYRGDLQSGGFLEKNCLQIRVDVRIYRDSPSMLDGHVETALGYAGLKNQGATCYLNSLLQSLFHLRAFRKAVYSIPTKDADQPESCIPLALQRLFYYMETSPNSRYPVGTKQLTKSFGWTTAESFQQHDVQELSRVLCDTLEEKMKGTVAEGALGKLFQGHTVSTIKCIDVDCTSSRKESFMDVQLNVKGCANVLDSFTKFCEEEKMEGDERYSSDEFGLQNAVKSIMFAELPPVLHLQLKRFEFDMQRGTTWKLHDRYEFTPELDLTPFLASPPATPADAVYVLHSVLVHSGGVHSGHYYAFINPTCEDGTANNGVADADAQPDRPRSPWLRFDDERVTREPARHALEDNFGEQPYSSGLQQQAVGGGNVFTPPPWKNPQTGRVSSAYMLVYVRKSDLNSVVRCPCSSSTHLAPHVAARFEAEREDKQRRRTEREEAHLYTTMKVCTDTHIAEHVASGPGGAFELMPRDWTSSQSPLFLVERMRTETTAAEVTRLVREKLLHMAAMQEDGGSDNAEMAIPAFRLWTWDLRKNGTVRPGRALTATDDGTTIAALAKEESSGSTSSYTSAWNQPAKNTSGLWPDAPGATTELRLYLELPQPWESTEVLPSLLKNDMLLFFKQFCLHKQNVSFTCHAIVNSGTKVADLRSILLRGEQSSAQLLFYEELEAPKLEELKTRDSVRQISPISGDVIIWQRAPQAGSDSHAGSFLHAPDYMAWAASRLVVTCQPLAQSRGSSNTYGPASQEASPPGESNLGVVVRLELSADTSYDEVAAALVAELAKAQPECVEHIPRDGAGGGGEYVRFTGHNSTTNAPRYDGPFTFRQHSMLGHMLNLPVNATSASAPSAVLHYEVLDIPLPQLEQMRQVTIDVFNDAVARVITLNVRVPRTRSTAADVLEAVRQQLRDGDPANRSLADRPLMLLMCHAHRVWDACSADTEVGDGQAYWHFRADSGVSADPESGVRLIHCTHAQRELPGGYLTHFGHPFLLSLTEADTLRDIKWRVAAKLGLTTAEVDAWKFSIHPQRFTVEAAAKPHLADEDLVLPAFGVNYKGPPEERVYDTFLAMEHAGPVRKAASAMGLKIHSDSRQNLWQQQGAA